NEVSEVTTAEEEVQSSKFLPKGKYFLLVILILSQAVGAYVVIDEHYKDIYIFIFGSLPDHSTTFLMEEIIANPAGTNAQRFLVVQIGIELSHIDHVVLMEDNMMKIKDRFNEVLSSRTVPELVQFEERDRLRRELAKEVNEAIGVRSVRNLYFTKYVMQ
ncbi:flagellar basal body-associated FliL family protein, partial [Balneolaceae bacterium ANBcel3]|nr:flagellar basal body-associated FliL family protein [Balneolaceae bacterium ANBcel3]